MTLVALYIDEPGQKSLIDNEFEFRIIGVQYRIIGVEIFHGSYKRQEFPSVLICSNQQD